MADENVAHSSASCESVPIEHIRKIREALLIGLESFGEVERVIDRHGLLSKHGKAPDADLLPLHPTGASDTIGVFASALRLLEIMEPENV
jgi:hypothetical protein